MPLEVVTSDGVRVLAEASAVRLFEAEGRLPKPSKKILPGLRCLVAYDLLRLVEHPFKLFRCDRASLHLPELVGLHLAYFRGRGYPSLQFCPA